MLGRRVIWGVMLDWGVSTLSGEENLWLGSITRSWEDRYSVGRIVGA